MNTRKKLPSVELLNEYYTYDPESGVLSWKKPSSKKPLTGMRAGHLRKKSGYREVKFGGVNYAEHRMVWKMHYKQEPPHTLDHINRNKDDNRICNLRSVSAAENGWNHSNYSTNTSGISGVSWDKERKNWRVTIWNEGKRLRAGRYPCKICAMFASQRLRRERSCGGAKGELLLNIMRLEKENEILKIENAGLRKAREDTHAKNSESIL